MAKRSMSAQNSYANSLGDLYDKMPKHVFAAIAVAYAAKDNSELAGDWEEFWDAVELDLVHEWWVLHQNGIIHKRPAVARMKPPR